MKTPGGPRSCPKLTGGYHDGRSDASPNAGGAGTSDKIGTLNVALSTAIINSLSRPFEGTFICYTFDLK